MKSRKLIVVLFIMITISLSACSQKPKYKMNDSDSLVQYTAGNSFIMTNDKILTVDRYDEGGSLWFVITPTSNSAIPLCYDPLCLHNNTECPAATVSGSSLGNMTCDDEYLYYAYSEDSAASKIFKIKLSDSTRKIIAEPKNRITGLKVYDSMLYYIENNNDSSNIVCRMDLSGSKREILLDGAQTEDFYDLFCVRDRYIYYLRSEHDGVYRFDMENAETICIYNGYVSNMFLSEQYLYLSCIDSETSSTRCLNLNDLSVSDLTINGKPVYGVLCVAYSTIFHIETEKVTYSSLQDEEMMEILGDEAARHAFDEKSYSNTKLYAYNMESGEDVLLGHYEMHTIHTLQLYDDKLYLKGILAKELGNNYILQEDFSANIDIYSGNMEYIEY